jgi:hypothetical protein
MPPAAGSIRVNDKLTFEEFSQSGNKRTLTSNLFVVFLLWHMCHGYELIEEFKRGIRNAWFLGRSYLKDGNEN